MKGKPQKSCWKKQIYLRLEYRSPREGDQDEDEPKIDERAERRRTRRSLFDEVDDLVPDAAEAEEHRLAKERARKGKAAVTSSTRSRKAPSVKEVEETLPPDRGSLCRGTRRAYP